MNCEETENLRVEEGVARVEAEQEVEELRASVEQLKAAHHALAQPYCGHEETLLVLANLDTDGLGKGATRTELREHIASLRLRLHRKTEELREREREIEGYEGYAEQRYGEGKEDGLRLGREEREQEAERLREALADMLKSADASWEERGEGHDWAEACEMARALLTRRPAPEEPKR